MIRLDKQRILGIDPGTNILGYGVLDLSLKTQQIVISGVIQLKDQEDHQSKLKEIFLCIQDLIENYGTGVLSIELPFYGKNAQSMLKLGRAQGVCIAAAIVMGLDIYEYSAKRIKKSVTGNGNASKEQVAHMITTLYKYTIESKYLDATDALAAAICHANQLNSPQGASASGAASWKKFIADHKDRVVK